MNYTQNYQNILNQLKTFKINFYNCKNRTNYTYQSPLKLSKNPPTRQFLILKKFQLHIRSQTK